MRTRAVGDFAIPCVGFGDVSLATSAARNVDAREVERALQDGLELGISLVDVADEVGAQQLTGDTIRSLRLRDRVVSAYRIASLPSRAKTPDALARESLERLPLAYVQSRVESILRGTKLDALPIVQLPLRPAWRSSSAWPELVGTCLRLVREGKVLCWGAIVVDDHEAGADLAALASLASEPWLVSLHVAYNLCDRTVEPLLEAAAAPEPEPESEPAPVLPPDTIGAGGLVVGGPMFEMMSAALSSPIASLALDAAVAQLSGAPPPPQASPSTKLARPRTAMFGSRVLAGGTLAGTFGPGVKLAIEDDRRVLDDAALARIAEGIAKLAPFVREIPPAARSTEAGKAIVDRMRRVDDVEARTVAELALRFAIDRGAIALLRLHRRSHFAEVMAAAAAKPLSPALHERLDEIFPRRDT